MKIQKPKAQKAQMLVSQSIPVEWYKNYIPPTPTIKPKLAEANKVPDLDIGSTDNVELSNSRTETTSSAANDTTMSRSLMSGTYAVSLPTHKMRMGVNINPNPSNKIESGKSTEQKEIGTKTKNIQGPVKEKITVGSFTCFELIGGRTNVPRALTTSAMAHPKYMQKTYKDEEEEEDENKNEEQLSQPKKEEVEEDVPEQFQLEEESDEENEEESD